MPTRSQLPPTRAMLYLPDRPGRWRRNLACLVASWSTARRLRRLGFNPSVAWSDALVRPDGPLRHDVDAARTAAACSAAWSARLGHTCLPRSLAMLTVLRANGVAGVRLRIGVDLDDPHGDKHAWVEVEGEPWLEPPELLDHLRAFPTAVGG